MCIVIVCYPVCDLIIFKFTLAFYQAVSLHEQTVRTKTEIPQEQKEFLR